MTQFVVLEAAVRRDGENPIFRSVLFAAMFALCTAAVHAQPRSAAGTQQRPATAIQVVFDNDFMGYHGTKAPPDYDYTSGIAIRMAWNRAPRFLHEFTGVERSCGAPAAHTDGWCVSSMLTLGQEIYTPRIDSVSPVPGERPYAGWLYAGGGARLVRQGRVLEVGLTAGPTGAPSLAEAVQTRMHRLFDARQRLGWAHQLPARAGVMAYLSDNWSLPVTTGDWQSALNASWNAKAGNIHNSLGTAGSVRFGRAYGEVESPIARAGGESQSVWVQLGAGADYVAYDFFIDAKPHGAASALSRNRWVGEATFAAGVQLSFGAVEYRAVLRSREYTTQLDPHSYGSIRVTLLR